MTVLMIVIGYGQFQLSSKTVRPSLLVEHALPPAGFREERGKLSHVYRFQNVGTDVARNVSITAITKHGDKVVHQDSDDEFGDIVLKQTSKYAIFVHDEDLAGLDIITTPVIEELRIIYRGENILQFWCEPTYTYSVVSMYDAKHDVWRPYPESVAAEDYRCE